MPTPILTTKLYIPTAQSKSVLRPRLTERLDEGLNRRLNLVSAPAGFGKTTLVSEWIASCEQSAAWLSLEEGDDDTSRFLTYFVAALQTIAGNIGEEVLAALQTPQPPPIESLLTALLNELTALQEPITIVLDDYHVIDFKAIDDALSFLIEHLPPQVNLIITTREDPRLPLARLRARGQLNELRAADLRFTYSEAADFINQVMGLDLSTDNITALENRTEGWIAGLQLAALSMQGHKNISGFIKSFTGSHQFVMDYLVEEVLQKQSESVKSFLLHTSILDRLCGPLCDAVLLNPAVSGQKTLEYIEHANLFIVPLDHERRWYRYHHLFADLLRQRLHQSIATTIGDERVSLAELHIRASNWYADNDMQFDAIQHAFAGKDFERAANLVELSCPEMDQNYQTDILLGWLKKLPEDLIRARPVLSVAYAWIILDESEVEKVESLLQHVERQLNARTQACERQDGETDRMIVVDQEQFRSLPATIANIRALLALLAGDVPGTLGYAQRALDLVPEKDYFRRGTITGTLGLTYWTTGDLETAYRSFTDCMANLKKAGQIHLAISVTYTLADIRTVQGRLHDALSEYDLSLRLAARSDKPLPLATAELYQGLSILNLEQGDLETSTQNLLKSKELGEKAPLPEWQYRWYLAKARMIKTQGDPEGALELLGEAEKLQLDPYIPDIRPMAALKTRVRIGQGRLTEAQNWAREQNLTVNDDLNFMQEFEHITLVRVRIAEYKAFGSENSIVEATELLERLEKAAELGGRMASVIEILVLQALAHEAQDDIPSALTPLSRALTLAEPEGYLRIFVDEGKPMSRLLSKAAANGIMPDYVSRLQTVIKSDKQKNEKLSSMPPDPPAQALIEPLSKRELEVLRLIAQGLANREIGERLFVALDTVKGHNRNIFGKLQVKRRTEAVARARELDLL